VDREAIGRDQRRRQAQEALDFERERETALREQLEDIVAELEGPRIDQAAFAAMQPEDVALVRATFEDAEDEAEEEGWLADGEPEADDDEERESEIARLQEEMAASRRRQEAFERYLTALGGYSCRRRDDVR
jgi:hypothetical protein